MLLSLLQPLLQYLDAFCNTQTRCYVDSAFFVCNTIVLLYQQLTETVISAAQAQYCLCCIVNTALRFPCRHTLVCTVRQANCTLLAITSDILPSVAKYKCKLAQAYV